MDDQFTGLQDQKSVGTELVTQGVYEALRAVDYLVALRTGVVRQSGLIDAVMRSPTNDDVATLLGHPRARIGLAAR